MYRSTKGASKARRDQINAEIRNLKELLPISDADKSRLSYLHIMSLACLYTRKSVFFTPGAGVEAALLPLISAPELADFMQALPGFLVALSSDGKLIYVSDNVAEHLGHSLVDLVAQGDSIYDITDSLDHLVLSRNLMFHSPADTERLFRCRFNTSRSVRRQSAGNKMVLIQGRYHPPPPGAYWSSKPIFIAFCAPLDTRPRLFDNHLFLGFFESQHSKDMMFMELSDSVSYYLGYQQNELVGKSWYNLLHPQDLSHASAQHYHLLSGASEARVEMIVRLQSKEALWVWLYIVAQVDCGEAPVLCCNYTASEAEAWCLRQQLMEEEEDTPLFPYALPAPATHPEALQSPDYLSSPDTVFTPVSSTPTSGVSAHSFDFSGLCGLDYGEVPTRAPAAGGEEEREEAAAATTSRLLGRGGPARLEDEAGPRRVAKLPELAYSDCLFGADCAATTTTTPPRTPQLPPAGFLFAGRDPFGQTAAELYYPAEPRGGLYEKLPPSPDSPGCGLAGLPEPRGPLYIHVPSAPEGILTPEASPIKLPASCYFGYLEEKERGHIDALAERLGYPWAGGQEEAFSDTPLADPQQDPAKHGCVSRCSSLPAKSPLPDFQALKQWRSVDFPMADFGREEEGNNNNNKAAAAAAATDDVDEIENILKDLGTPTIPGSSPDPASHQPAGSSGCPISLDSDRAGAPLSMDSRPATDLSPEEQSFLEELASYETVFEVYASRSPCDGFNDELYQLQSHGHEYFHQDGSGGEPSF
uniref:neuronal PAS domain-containing protein 4-like n=1 Tax=Pristiophorus japonicus TaxID=55135 RepID=UPI00398F8C9F